ncbi:MAG TPA: Leg1-related protein [Kofleriaceae bacterium]|nr:Leg1-related protein [Kofleriaceae bacterium]
MAFSSTRPDRSRLARVPFGDDWLALADPSDRAGSACDPMAVTDRLAMYRLLVERSGPHGALGAHDELSPFWGYASQLAWQHRSGRLGDASSSMIDPASWWGACNYALCVVPYAAAAALGVVPGLRFPVPSREYDAALAAWRIAFEVLGAQDVDLDRARVATWRAHLASISIACARHRTELATLAADEQRFARGWVRMVDLFAAAAIRTDLVRLADEGDGGALPSRVLDARGIDDLPRAERSTVRRIFALADRPRLRWRAELTLWRRTMRTRSARAESSALLSLFVGRTRSAWPLRLRAFAYATLPVAVIDR